MRKIVRKIYKSHSSVVIVIPQTLAAVLGMVPGRDVEFKLLKGEALVLTLAGEQS